MIRAFCRKTGRDLWNGLRDGLVVIAEWLGLR
jgi:hypothetical protein